MTVRVVGLGRQARLGRQVRVGRQVWSCREAWSCRDRGAAVVDFALVGGLLTLIFAAVVQLVVVLHIRNVLIDCAVEGARTGALADRSPVAGAARTRELIRAELNDTYAEQVSAGHAWVDGLDTIQVTVQAPLPVLGLLGPRRRLSVSGHALAEP